MLTSLQTTHSLGRFRGRALFSMRTLPCSRGRGPASQWPPLVSRGSRVRFGGRELCFGELLLLLPTASRGGLLLFRGRQWRRRLSACPLADLSVAGLPQFRGGAIHLHRLAHGGHECRGKSIHTWGFPWLLQHLGVPVKTPQV